MQLTGTATVHDERLDARQRGRRSCAGSCRPSSPTSPVADPAVAHPRQIQSILGISIAVDAVSAKFKYGGNVDEAHRLAVVDHLQARQGPGDVAAAGHVVRRLGGTPPRHVDALTTAHFDAAVCLRCLRVPRPLARSGRFVSFISGEPSK